MKIDQKRTEPKLQRVLSLSLSMGFQMATGKVFQKKQQIRTNKEIKR